MDKKDVLSYTTIIYGDSSCGKTTFLVTFNVIKNKRNITLSELAETIGLNFEIFSKILYSVNTIKATKLDVIMHIVNNLVYNKLKEHMYFIYKYKDNIVYHLIKFLDRLSDHTEQKSLFKIRGDTLCFSF